MAKTEIIVDSKGENFDIESINNIEEINSFIENGINSVNNELKKYLDKINLLRKKRSYSYFISKFFSGSDSNLVSLVDKKSDKFIKYTKIIIKFLSRGLSMKTNTKVYNSIRKLFKVKGNDDNNGLGMSNKERRFLSKDLKSMGDSQLKNLFNDIFSIRKNIYDYLNDLDKLLDEKKNKDKKLNKTEDESTKIKENLNFDKIENNQQIEKDNERFNINNLKERCNDSGEDFKKIEKKFNNELKITKNDSGNKDTILNKLFNRKKVDEFKTQIQQTEDAILGNSIYLLDKIKYYHEKIIDLEKKEKTDFYCTLYKKIENENENKIDTYKEIKGDAELTQYLNNKLKYNINKFNNLESSITKKTKHVKNEINFIKENSKRLLEIINKSPRKNQRFLYKPFLEFGENFEYLFEVIKDLELEKFNDGINLINLFKNINIEDIKNEVNDELFFIKEKNELIQIANNNIKNEISILEEDFFNLVDMETILKKFEELKIKVENDIKKKTNIFLKNKNEISNMINELKEYIDKSNDLEEIEIEFKEIDNYDKMENKFIYLKDKINKLKTSFNKVIESKKYKLEINSKITELEDYMKSISNFNLEQEKDSFSVIKKEFEEDKSIIGNEKFEKLKNRIEEVYESIRNKLRTYKKTKKNEIMKKLNVQNEMIEKIENFFGGESVIEIKEKKEEIILLIKNIDYTNNVFNKSIEKIKNIIKELYFYINKISERILNNNTEFILSSYNEIEKILNEHIKKFREKSIDENIIEDIIRDYKTQSFYTNFITRYEKFFNINNNENIRTIIFDHLKKLFDENNNEEYKNLNDPSFVNSCLSYAKIYVNENNSLADKLFYIRESIEKLRKISKILETLESSDSKDYKNCSDKLKDFEEKFKSDKNSLSKTNFEKLISEFEILCRDKINGKIKYYNNVSSIYDNFIIKFYLLKENIQKISKEDDGKYKQFVESENFEKYVKEYEQQVSDFKNKIDKNDIKKLINESENLNFYEVFYNDNYLKKIKSYKSNLIIIYSEIQNSNDSISRNILDIENKFEEYKETQKRIRENEYINKYFEQYNYKTYDKKNHIGVRINDLPIFGDIVTDSFEDTEKNLMIKLLSSKTIIFEKGFDYNKILNFYYLKEFKNIKFKNVVFSSLNDKLDQSHASCFNAGSDSYSFNNFFPGINFLENSKFSELELNVSPSDNLKLNCKSLNVLKLNGEYAYNIISKIDFSGCKNLKLVKIFVEAFIRSHEEFCTLYKSFIGKDFDEIADNDNEGLKSQIEFEIFNKKIKLAELKESIKPKDGVSNFMIGLNGSICIYDLDFLRKETIFSKNRKDLIECLSKCNKTIVFSNYVSCSAFDYLISDRGLKLKIKDKDCCDAFGKINKIIFNCPIVSEAHSDSFNKLFENVEEIEINYPIVGDKEFRPPNNVKNIKINLGKIKDRLKINNYSGNLKEVDITSVKDLESLNNFSLGQKGSQDNNILIDNGLFETITKKDYDHYKYGYGINNANNSKINDMKNEQFYKLVKENISRMKISKFVKFDGNKLTINGLTEPQDSISVEAYLNSNDDFIVKKRKEINELEFYPVYYVCKIFESGHVLQRDTNNNIRTITTNDYAGNYDKNKLFTNCEKLTLLTKEIENDLHFNYMKNLKILNMPNCVKAKILNLENLPYIKEIHIDKLVSLSSISLNAEIKDLTIYANNISNNLFKLINSKANLKYKIMTSNIKNLYKRFFCCPNVDNINLIIDGKTYNHENRKSSDYFE